MTFQAKMHGGEFPLIPPRNEGVRCMPQSLSQLAVRDPNFHTSSSVSQIVPLSPGKVGKKGRAIGLGICIASSVLFRLCQRGCAGPTWELPVVLAGVRTRTDAVLMGSNPGKSVKLLHLDNATAFSSPRWEDELRSLVEAHFIDEKTWVQRWVGIYPRTALSSCWKA